MKPLRKPVRNVQKGQMPENFRYHKGYPFAGSAFISSRREIEWLARKGFNTVISLEPVDDGTIRQLNRFGIKHFQFPTADVDEASCFTQRQREQLLEIVRQEWNAGRKVLVHCLQGKGRTGEAMNLLWDLARQEFPEREQKIRVSFARTGQKIEKRKR